MPDIMKMSNCNDFTAQMIKLRSEMYDVKSNTSPRSQDTLPHCAISLPEMKSPTFFSFPQRKISYHDDNIGSLNPKPTTLLPKLLASSIAPVEAQPKIDHFYAKNLIMNANPDCFSTHLTNVPWPPAQPSLISSWYGSMLKTFAPLPLEANKSLSQLKASIEAANISPIPDRQTLPPNIAPSSHGMLLQANSVNCHASTAASYDRLCAQPFQRSQSPTEGKKIIQFLT